jgi:hypothetical protein
MDIYVFVVTNVSSNQALTSTQRISSMVHLKTKFVMQETWEMSSLGMTVRSKTSVCTLRLVDFLLL